MSKNEIKVNHLNPLFTFNETYDIGFNYKKIAIICRFIRNNQKQHSIGQEKVKLVISNWKKWGNSVCTKKYKQDWVRQQHLSSCNVFLEALAVFSM